MIRISADENQHLDQGKIVLVILYHCSHKQYLMGWAMAQTCTASLLLHLTNINLLVLTLSNMLFPYDSILTWDGRQKAFTCVWF